MRNVLMLGLAMTSLFFLNLSVFAEDDLTRGVVVYNRTCIACHGGDGAGSLPGVPDLTSKAGPLPQEDDVLLKRMVNGFQSPGSILGMPPRGGDPSLTDEDLQAVLKFMRKEFQQIK